MGTTISGLVRACCPAHARGITGGHLTSPHGNSRVIRQQSVYSLHAVNLVKGVGNGNPPPSAASASCSVRSRIVSLLSCNICTSFCRLPAFGFLGLVIVVVSSISAAPH